MIEEEEKLMSETEVMESEDETEHEDQFNHFTFDFQKTQTSRH